MSKFLRFAIPLILACLALGLIFSMSGATNRATAAPILYSPEATIHVTTLDDDLNNDGDCSLREAIQAANSNTAVDACQAGDGLITDTVIFDVMGTITLTNPITVTNSGPLEIDGANTITVTGGSSVRILYVDINAGLTLNDLTFEDGFSSNGGAINNVGKLTISHSNIFNNNAVNGGGIINDVGAVLTINGSTVSGNYATHEGGGIDNKGTLTVLNSSLLYNQSNIGSGMLNEVGGVMDITSSTLSGNIGSGVIENAGGEIIVSNSILSLNLGGVGGGIRNDEGVLAISNCTLSNNEAQSGGSIQNQGTMVITGTTFYSNHSTHSGGGAIDNIGGTLAISNSTLSDNYSASSGGGIDNGDGSLVITNTTFIRNGAILGGGAIWNGNEVANLKIIDSTFSDNYADSGGAIDNAYGTVIVINSAVTGNEASDGAGGIGNYRGRVEVVGSDFSGNTNLNIDGGAIKNWGGWFTISTSTLSSNIAQSGAGIKNGSGIYEGGTMTITQTTISGNNATQEGGGIDNGGALTVVNSTLSGNSANSGGGIYNENGGTLTMTYSTMAQNSAIFGGGLNNPSGNAYVDNSIIANSVISGNCFGIISDGGHNISSDDSCSLDPAKGSMTNTNPYLGLLQNHGGPTYTYDLLWISPAIDSGDDAQCPSTDQRGALRPQDGNGDGLSVCDIGAYELTRPVYIQYLSILSNLH